MKSVVSKGMYVSTMVLACCAAACGSREEGAVPADELDGVPELAAVHMSLTDATDVEGAASDDDRIDLDAVADDLDLIVVPEEAAEDLVAGQHAIRQLNDALRSFLGPVVKLVRNTEPSVRVGASRVWGPVTRGDVEYRLMVRHAAEGRFSWRLDARSTGAPSAFRRVALGRLVRGDEARRGKGGMGLDLDALAAIDDGVKARGKVLVGFRHGDAGTTLGYSLTSFTPDVDSKPAIDALLRGVHLKQGINRVRLAYHGDVAGSASDAQEFVLARLRHARGIGGRSDVIALGGDVPEGQIWVRSQCWSAKLAKTFAEVQLCPLETPIDLSACAVLETSGDVTACDKTLRDPELPPADPEAEMEDAKDPNADVEVPSEIDELVDPEME